MKKCIPGFILVLCLLCGCSDVYEEVILTDPADYGAMWSLQERRIYESELLPSALEGIQVQSFYCKHTVRLPVGTDWQVLLTIRYTDAQFQQEVERLQLLCAEAEICGETTYATAWNWIGCYEYAMVDPDTHTIGYVYLQMVDREEVAFDQTWIPEGYPDNWASEDIQGPSYSIYE